MSAPEHAEVVVCGAGIAGIAVAWYLVVRANVRNVVLVEAGAPLSLTSDKSTECYRNWWPESADMTAYMNRSIDLLEALAEQTDNRFALDRRGYLFATARPEQVAQFEAQARAAEALGAGPLRIHRASQQTELEYRPARGRGYEDQPDGADLLVGTELVQQEFPYLDARTIAALHTRRCGGLGAQQLGMTLLEQAREAGLRLLTGEVVEVDTSGGRVRSVQVSTRSGSQRIVTPRFVNCAGPYAAAVARMCGVTLPVECERHVKLTFNDREAVVPRDAPLLLWVDPVTLPWNDEERAALAEDASAVQLLAPYPAGVHGRPLGRGDSLALYWTYDCPVEAPSFPLQWDPQVPEIYLRGMSVMLPRLAQYFSHMPNACVDGGYYTKTPDNRPLIGPLPVDGAYASVAFSGFGIMASLAGAELLVSHMTGVGLPAYAEALVPGRFDDAGYLARMRDAAANSGQL